MVDHPVLQSAAVMAGESPPRLRAAAACIACNKKKIRCIYPDGRQECLNCSRNHWECSPRERKRKRRKTAVDYESTAPASDGNDDGPTPPPSRRATWDSGMVGWEAGRTIVAEANPSVTSRSSAGGATTQSQYGAKNSSMLETVGSPLYANTATTLPPALPHSQQQEARPYEASPGHSSLLGRSDYVGGDFPINEDQAKLYPPGVTERLSDEDIRVLQIQHAFDLPPRAVREGLIDTFMKRCSPWMPIVERSWLMERHGNQPSILLLQAIFLAASRVSSAPAVAAYASSNEFYRRAKALFWSGYEKNTITVITAVCILHWYNPEGPEHVSINTSGFWNRVGIGLAYQIGLHKEPPQGRDAPLRRRLWWTLFARDCLISASQGRPRAANMDDSEVRPLSAEDFYGSSSNGALFIAYVELCSLLGELTQCCCRRYLSRQKRLYIENALYRWTRELPEHLRLFRRTGSSEGSSSSQLALMPYNFEARQLHVPYFIILGILYRFPSPGNAPSTAAILASSFVAGIFEDFLARDEIRFLGPIFTFYLLVSGMGLLSCYRYPHLWERVEQDLHIVYNAQKELAKRWPSATGSFRALQGITEEVAKGARRRDVSLIGSLTPEQEACFSGFGADLCRIRDLILTPHGHDLLDPRRHEEVPYSRSVSDMMTAGILAELKAPMDASAGFDGYLPLATMIDDAPSGGESADVADVTLCGPYEGIGNWLLRDWNWNNDIPW